MNKYITALLVVLATTGVEAQSYQSVLKIALGDVNIEDLCHQQAFKEDEEIEPAQNKAVFVADIYDNYPTDFKAKSNNYQKLEQFLPNPSLRSGIKIRAPNRYSLS